MTPDSRPSSWCERAVEIVSGGGSGMTGPSDRSGGCPASGRCSVAPVGFPTFDGGSGHDRVEILRRTGGPLDADGHDTEEVPCLSPPVHPIAPASRDAT